VIAATTAHSTLRPRLLTPGTLVSSARGKRRQRQRGSGTGVPWAAGVYGLSRQWAGDLEPRRHAEHAHMPVVRRRRHPPARSRCSSAVAGEYRRRRCGCGVRADDSSARARGLGPPRRPHSSARPSAGEKRLALLIRPSARARVKVTLRGADACADKASTEAKVKHPSRCVAKPAALDRGTHRRLRRFPRAGAQIGILGGFNVEITTPAHRR